MAASDALRLGVRSPVRAHNAGLAITQGKGTHPTRVIDSHELIFVRAGTLWMFEGRREFRVEPGEALHLWPGRRHGGLRTYERGLAFYWVHFYVESRGGARTGEGALHIPSHAVVSRPDHLTELFRRFLDDQESGWLTRQAADLLVLLMLAEVAETRPRADGRVRGPEALAAKAHAFICSHLCEDIGASRIAAVLRCNPDYLGRVYRMVYGMSLTDAIHRLRVRKARRMLLDSTMNVGEIARECGFADGGYFRRIFRRHEHLSPRAYRHLYGRMHVNVV
jgi:AraC-like DNA-binding protein